PLPAHGARDDPARAGGPARRSRGVRPVLGGREVAGRPAGHGGPGFVDVGPVRRPARLPRLPARSADAAEARSEGALAARWRWPGREGVAVRRRFAEDPGDGLGAAPDPRPTEHFVSSIEYRRLPRRDSEGGLLQTDADVSARQRLQPGCERLAAMADLHLARRTGL